LQGISWLFADNRGTMGLGKPCPGTVHVLMATDPWLSLQSVSSISKETPRQLTL